MANINEENESMGPLSCISPLILGLLAWVVILAPLIIVISI